MTEPAQHAPTREWSREFDGSLSEIARTVAWVESVARTLQLGEDQTYAMALCADELVSNVLTHNGAKVDRLHVRVTVEAKENCVALTIEDNGVFFDIVNAPAKRVDQPLEALQPGGLGVGLVKRFASSLEYDRIEDRNKTVATFLS